MKKLLIPFFVLLVIVISMVIYLYSQTAKTGTGLYPAAKPDVTTSTQTEGDFASIQSLGIALTELDSSTQMGGVSLIEKDGKLTVSIDVTDIGDTPQPAHIHLGSCPTPGEVFLPLSPVVNGKSETVLDKKMADILKELPMAINIHKSTQEPSVYTSCGDIILPSAE